MLALTIIARAAVLSPDHLAGLRSAIAEYPGDVAIVARVGRRRLLLGAAFTVEPSLELEARLRDLGFDLGPSQEVRSWR